MHELRLATVTHDPETDAVLTAKSLPGLTGNGPWNLHCGGCEEVVAKGLNPASIAKAFPTRRRLLLRCTCGAYNLVREAQPDAESAKPAA